MSWKHIQTPQIPHQTTKVAPRTENDLLVSSTLSKGQVDPVELRRLKYPTPGLNKQTHGLR